MNKDQEKLRYPEHAPPAYTPDEQPVKSRTSIYTIQPSAPPLNLISENSHDNFAPLPPPPPRPCSETFYWQQNQARVTCSKCGEEVLTKTKRVIGRKTHKAALLYFSTIICIPLACVAYCSDATKDTEHFCPLCESLLGRYEIPS